MTQVDKRNVTDTAYDQLLDMIVHGTLKPGERLPSENELKNQLNVSRNTLRTVLNRLNVLGVLETRRGDGTYVRPFGLEMPLNTYLPSALMSANDLVDMIAFRKGFECESARQAAIHATDEDIELLRRLLPYVHQNEADDRYAYSSLDFHIQIAVASKNNLFVKMLELIKYMISSKLNRFLEFESDVSESGFYHQMIFECIANHKPEEAAYLMERHMTLLLKHVHDYSDYTADKTP